MIRKIKMTGLEKNSSFSKGAWEIANSLIVGSFIRLVRFRREYRYLDRNYDFLCVSQWVIEVVSPSCISNRNGRSEGEGG